MGSIDADLIGSRIRDARRKRGWTQARLASKAGVRRETIYRTEAGRDANADTLARIADAMSLQHEDLMVVADASSKLYGHALRTPLRDRRRTMRLTLWEVATASGLSASTVSRFERGNWYYPSICVVGRSGLATAIHNEGMASILGFADAAALTAFWLTHR